MEHDGSWLASELTKVLDGWDLDVAGSIVGAIDATNSRQEVDDIIMNFMNGDAAVKSLVYKFLEHKARVESQDWQQESTPPSPPPPQASGRPPSGSQERPPSSTAADRRQDGKQKGRKNTKTTPPPKLPAAPQVGRSLNSGNYVSQALDRLQAEGGGKPGKGKGAAKEKRTEKKSGGKKKSQNPSQIDQQLPTAANLERKVANCLGCGKIYDCRKVTEEILRFLESNGTCNFCGRSVNLRYRSTPTNSSAAPSQDKAAAKMSGPSSQMSPGQTSAPQPSKPVDESVSKAVEFKNKLVEYDRNHEKRTTVIDDQSDYFEIETNVWLSKQERKELRERCDHERDVAEQRKRQVRYTIDLVGRRVMVAENPTVSDESKAKAKLVETAAAATSKEYEQGGGTAAGAAQEAAGRLGGSAVMSGGQALQNLKAMPNPSIPGPAPVFMPSSNKENDGSKGKSDGARKGNRWARGFGARLQHDDIFAGFEAEAEVAVMFEDLASILNTQAEKTFDICPELDETKEAMPTVIRPDRGDVKISANARLSNMLVPSAERPASTTQGPEPRKLAPGERLPPGMVLLKGMMSLDQQVQILNDVRTLGNGPGGFYTPSYTDGAELSLKMMCLGKHWDPRSRSYEDVRSSVDGARPPPIPDLLKELVQQSLKAASKSWGNKYPEMDPNVCLCNFYTPESSLGLHQDKEEGPESCRRRIPVVSFSIGATGSFVFNKKQSMEGASSIDLESGDVLVFGGPSRMVFHGLRKIYPETMPPELASLANMRLGRLNLTFRQYIAPVEEEG
ncbi:hypothetical protein BSKO_06641 [Bryopsis sp. KO-2023]|nr:hypothetical protein BSKO_06641 [Bryopsis sp. KO-2023]